MQIPGIPNRFLKDNIYLLLISLLLLAVSIFTGKEPSAKSLTKTYTQKLQSQIDRSENEFEKIIQNKVEVDKLIASQKDISLFDEENKYKQYIFVYKNVKGINQLTFWSTQNIIPDSSIANSKENYFFKKLVNGYFFIQKKNTVGNIIVSLTPIKWQYSMASNYLENNFITDPLMGLNFEINFQKSQNEVLSREGTFLFSLKNINPGEKLNSRITIWLRICSLIPLLLFLHFTSLQLYAKRGFIYAVSFLSVSLLILRLLSYYFFNILQLRSFELFDPSIYGSGLVLRSLGDLLINSLLFFWVISFIKSNIKHASFYNKDLSRFKKWIVLNIAVFVVLFITYATTEIIKSMVADSQISFDVLNFFTLNIYSIIGFVVLSFIGVSGFFISCATCFAISCQALSLSLFASAAALSSNFKSILLYSFTSAPISSFLFQIIRSLVLPRFIFFILSLINENEFVILLVIMSATIPAIKKIKALRLIIVIKKLEISSLIFV